MQIMLNSFSFATCVDAQQIVIELTFSTASGYFFIISSKPAKYTGFFMFFNFCYFFSSRCRTVNCKGKISTS